MYEDQNLDLAIFALFAYEPSWRSYIRKSQLTATDRHNYSSTFGGQNVFCVGYAGPFRPVFEEYVNDYQSMYQHDAQVQQVFQNDVRETSMPRLEK